MVIVIEKEIKRINGITVTMIKFNYFINLFGLFLFIVLIGNRFVECLIAEDLADLATHLTDYQCKVLQSVLTKKQIGLIESQCFEFLINQRVYLKTKYPRDGDKYFLGNLTETLIEIGLEGSATKLITLNLREKIISVNVNQLSRLEEIREEEEAEEDATAFVKNPFEAIYSISRGHDRLTQQSNEMLFDIIVLASLFSIAIILTYALIVTVRNLDVPDDIINRDEVVHRI